MATVTPNFNWPVPTPTDLVRDGATAIEALGDSIDASLVDLKGGTTGQVLSKNSNTDMDFTWVTDAAGDITGVTAGTGISGGGTSGTVTVTNSMATAIDAKGDLVPGTGADTFARLAVGANGTVLTADSAEATGLKWATPSSGLTYAAWTPTTTGITVGNGTLTARYAQSGKFVNGSFIFQLGSTSAITSAGISFTLPVTSKSTYNFEYSSLIVDASVEPVIGMVVADPTIVYVGCAKSSTSFAEYASINASQPFTFTTNDRIVINFSYEAA
jgi:hypothetical protein